MFTFGKLISNVKGFYNDINSATLTGAIDVVVVEQPDGTLVCSPFHVRFGKLGVLRSREKVVDIAVNDESIPLQMKLDDAGVAFFVEELDEHNVPNEPHMMCSPIPPDKPHDILDDSLQENPFCQIDEGTTRETVQRGVRYAQLTEETPEPTGESAQPSEENAQPNEEFAQPSEEFTQPIEVNAQPHEESAQTFEENLQPVKETIWQIDESAWPIRETGESVWHTKKNAQQSEETIWPNGETVLQTEETVLPNGESVQLTAETVESTEESVQLPPTEKIMQLLPAEESVQLLPAEESVQLLPAEESVQPLPAEESTQSLPAEEIMQPLPAKERVQQRLIEVIPEQLAERKVLPRPQSSNVSINIPEINFEYYDRDASLIENCADSIDVDNSHIYSQEDVSVDNEETAAQQISAVRYPQHVLSGTPLTGRCSINALGIDISEEGISEFNSAVVASDTDSFVPDTDSFQDSDTSTVLNTSTSDQSSTVSSSFEFFKHSDNLAYSNDIQILSSETKESRNLHFRVDNTELAYQSSESSCTYDTTPSEDEREKSEGNIPSSGDQIKSVTEVSAKVTSRNEDFNLPTKDVAKSSAVGVKRRRRKKITSKKVSQKKNLGENDATSVPQLGEEKQDGSTTTTRSYNTASSSLGTDGSDASTYKVSLNKPVISIGDTEKLLHTKEKMGGVSDDDLSAALSRMPHSQMDENFAFFSDTELAEGSNDEAHFPSDTECVIKRKEDSDEREVEEQEQSWRWGELPTPPTQVSAIHKKDAASTAEEIDAKDEKDETQAPAAMQPRRLLYNVFNFMNMTKKIRRNPESEGIYLEDLDSGDITPEVAALYFPTAYRRSQLNLPKEPSSYGGGGDATIVGPGSLSRPTETDSFSHTATIVQEDKEGFSEIALSLCGKQIYTSPAKKEVFENAQVTYEIFVNDIGLLENPNLIVRFDGQYMTWESALPQIVALMVFKKCLPANIVEKLREKFEQAAVEVHEEHSPQETQAHAGASYKLWLPWRRSTEAKESKLTADEDGSASSTRDEKESSSVRPKSLPRLTSVLQSENQTVPNIQQDVSGDNNANYRNADAHDGSSGSGSSDDSELMDRLYSHEAFDTSSSSLRPTDKLHRKTLRLTSDQLVSLRLQPGSNKAVFSVTTAYQGTTRCMCHVYKWRYDDKIVISDIDGTITRSDVLGHVLPMLGKDWAQSGVAQLFTKISNNGYKLLYLSARAIGQSTVTRGYLKSVKQNNLSLPDGPVLLSPTSLLNAFHREVIEKKPEHFKIPCLKDVVSLFPSNREPMYAGFGNRDSDFFAYSMIGIPEDRIFTINSRGEVKHGLRQILISSYSNLTDIVDQMFPPSAERQEADRYSSFTHWRAPVRDIFE